MIYIAYPIGISNIKIVVDNKEKYMSNEDDDSIQQLRKRVAALEIDNTYLKAEVRNLKKGTPETARASNRASVKARSVASSHHEPRPPPKQGYKVFKDRDGTELDIGTKVLILTRGAFTKGSSKGTINGFDDYRNRVYILDERNITQERAPTNVRVNPWE